MTKMNRLTKILLLRYKELLRGGRGGTTDNDVPFEIEYTIIEKDTGRIDNEYLDSRFEIPKANKY